MSLLAVFMVCIFLLFGLNTEIYSVNLRIQSECREIETRKYTNTDTFYAVWLEVGWSARRNDSFNNCFSVVFASGESKEHGDAFHKIFCFYWLFNMNFPRFVELGHFDKDFVKSNTKRGPAGKDFVFFPRYS